MSQPILCLLKLAQINLLVIWGCYSSLQISDTCTLLALNLHGFIITTLYASLQCRLFSMEHIGLCGVIQHNHSVKQLLHTGFFSLTFSICWNGFFFILRPKSNAVSRSHSHLHDIGVSHAVFYLTRHLPVNHFSKDLWSKKLIKKNIIFNVSFFSGDGTSIVKAQGISLWSTPVLCSCFNFKCNSCSVWLTLPSILGVQS